MPPADGQPRLTAVGYGRPVYGEAPELATVADDSWSAVQDRLERTHAAYAGKTSPLNDSHRARYLLNGLVKCGCCHGGYTIVRKERYGCYKRKTQGAQECGNSCTVSRDKLEDRVLARLRRDLMISAFAQQFAREVERLMTKSPDDATAARAELEARLRKTEPAQPSGR